MAQFFADAHTHVAALLQVAETTKGVIVLADSDEDGICAFRADRVRRYVYLVED